MAMTTTQVQNTLDNLGYQWQQNKAMAAATNGTNLGTGAATAVTDIHGYGVDDTIALLEAARDLSATLASPKQAATIWANFARKLNTATGGLNAYLTANPTVKLTTNAAELLTALGIAYPAESVDDARTDAA